MESTIQYNGETFNLVNFSQDSTSFNTNWETTCSEKPVYQVTYSNGNTTIITFHDASMVEVGRLVI